MPNAIRYRVGQFFQALLARPPRHEEIEETICTLTPPAQALFRRQAAQDQHHALEVHHALQEAGHADPQLLAAALLHDVGKAAARLSPWHRAAIVLLRHLAPRLLAHLSRGEPRWWSRAFVAHARHAETGARWAEDAGCSRLTVALIQRHQDRPPDCRSEEDRLLAALQAADDLN